MASPDIVEALVREHARLMEEERILARASDLVSAYVAGTGEDMALVTASGVISDARMAVRRRALEVLLRLDIAGEVRRWPSGW